MSPALVYEEIKRYEKERVTNDSTYWLVFELLWRDFFRFYAMHHGRRMFFAYGTRRSAPVHARDEKRVSPESEWSQDPRLVTAWFVLEVRVVFCLWV